MNKQNNHSPPATDPLSRLAAWFEQSGRDVDIVILLLLAVVALVAFANVLDGDFVYDDTRQILQNPLVRERGELWSALTTDVWAFKSGGTEVVSDYWRPAFVLWLVINERLFGLENTAGWHLANVLLHIGTAVLTYILLRQLKINRPLTIAVVLVFLLHPVHVETVSWISGSPDLLMALPILGAFSLLLSYQKTADKKRYLAALFLFTLALLAKEAAVLFPILIFLFFLLWASDKTRINVRKVVAAGRSALPFFLVAVLYLVARMLILGHITADRPWQQPLSHVILTIPSIMTFYLRQAIFPLELGPSYPLRLLGPADVNFQNFWIPLTITITSIAILLFLVYRSSVKQIGLTIFFLFLLPSFNLNAFHPEHIVHDRYLYLPLFGFLIIVILSLNDVLSKFTDRALKKDWKPLQISILTLFAIILLTLPLTLQTIRYNLVWKTELALWERGIQTDPTSMLNTYLYGYHVFRNGRPDLAQTAMNTVIENQPLTTGPYYTYLRAVEAYLERADIAASQGQTEQARADLNVVIALSPDNISQENRANLEAQQQRAFERLALSYIQDQQLETAVQTLENARQTLPQLTCTFTTNLAVTLYLSGQKENALTELESIQDRVELEYTPLCKMSLFYLGQLYIELGRTAEARSSLTAFLIASDPFYDEQTLNLRQQAESWLTQN